MAFAKFMTLVRIVEVLAAFLVVLLAAWGVARFFNSKRKNRPQDE